MKSKPIKMDNARLTQVEDGSIVIKPHNFTTWLMIVVLSLFILFMLWGIITNLLRGVFEFEGVAITFVLALWMFALIYSLRKKTIVVKVPARIIEINRGFSTRQILFSTVVFIAIYKGKNYDPVQGIHILAFLSDKEVIPLGRISGSNAKDVHTRAESIAQLLAHSLGVEVRQDMESR